MTHPVPDRWDEAADIVIVGSGFAGLAAATEAAERGADVLILEKMPYFGGNSALSGGGYASWDSRMKRRETLGLGADSWQLHYSDTIKGGKQYNIPDLVEVMVRSAPDGLNWLADAGVPFKNSLVKLGLHSACRVYQTSVIGKKVIDPILNLALGKGAVLRLNTEVTEIYRESETGPVLGVGIRSDGICKTIRARKAVILASGGYGQDVKMRTDYRADLGDEYNCTNHRGATGEMIRYARAVGADVLHLEFIQLFPCAHPKSGAVDREALICYSGPGFGMIYTDKSGARFVNELTGRDEVAQAQIARGQKPTCSIFHKEICDALLMSEKAIADSIASGRMIGGATVAELEQKLGMPAAGLEDTIARHNRAIETGNDTEFGKPMDDAMIPMKSGPIYAIAQWPSIHFCMGGLRINPRTQVIDIWGAPIERLYAAGEICGGVHGANRLGGNAITECIVYGRIAGVNAAQEASANE